MSRSQEFDAGADPVRFHHYEVGGITGVQAYRGADPVAGQYLGGAMYRVGNEHTTVDSVTVQPEHRRQGVGTNLLREVESHTGRPVRIGPGRNTKAGKALFSRITS